MKILVLNGSPKGASSITLQTVRFLEKHFPEHTFTILQAGAAIKRYEHDLAQALEELEKAEMILFSYPVYTFLVPSQLHRFLELIKESGISLAGKWATQITTSKHFFDTTAHGFIEENAGDLGLKMIRGLSADMDDLLTEKGREDALRFFRYVLWCVEHDVHEPAPQPRPAFVPAPVSVPTDSSEKSGDVVIVADLREEDTSLAAMIDRFRASCALKTRVVNLREFPFKGGCLSCFHCAPAGQCVYQDGFDTFLRENIQRAQAIVIAFTIRDHSMGSLFKLYDDRQFCNGHRTVTMGLPFGYLVSGPLNSEPNLQNVLAARPEVGGNFSAGIATDEHEPDAEIDRMAARLCYAIGQRYSQPANFWGVGGMKIFRDLIWLMQGLMRADHKFYKRHGQYDFPQKHFGTMLKMYPIGALMKNPRLMQKAGGKVTEGMIAPYRKAVEKY